MSAILNDSLYTDSLFNSLSRIGELCSQNPPNCAYDWFSLIAAGVTVICFFITLFQLSKVKSTNKQIKDALDAYADKIQSYLTIITVSDARRIADMVLLLIDGGLYREAVVRMQDLNSAAIELKSKYPSLRTLQMTLPSEMEHLKDIDQCQKANSQSLFRISDTRRVVQLLHDAMCEIESKIKSQTIIKKE